MLKLISKVVTLLLLCIHIQGYSHDFKILVFTKTAGFSHGSIEQGVDMLEQLGADNDFEVEVTEDASFFTLTNLQQYATVVFLSTTGDVLNNPQQTAFEQYIQGGGGYVGIHAASDTEFDWPWYGDLVGAYFSNHPPGTHEAAIKVSDRVHPSTENLPFSWTRTDEWYNFEVNPRGNVHVLATLDETSYEGGEMGYDHPIVWCHEFDGGRSWYTAGGHTAESFSEPLFVQHVLGGILYTTKEINGTFDATIDDNFEVSVIDNSPSNPMALSMLPDNRVLYIERSGNIKLYDPTNGTISIAANLDVDSNREDGLIGIVLDPNFETNNWLYIFYSPAGDEAIQHVSRLTFSENFIDLSSEEILMKIPVQREQCCHSGGDLEFDANGNLYIALGDNTNPFSSDGYAPIDEQTSYLDAQGTSGNTNDYRGKILRIKPENNGTYSVPQGNLFTDSNEGLPEIYAMGLRNPFRFTVGPDGYLYVGEVGPDSNVNSNNRGPRGYDEFNRTNVATNFGWPYCSADNQSYVDYNFATGVSGDNFDCDNPVNTSINNTGATNLPPASPAWIWYHDGVTDAFPAMGTGSGRTAMAGGVYQYDESSTSEVKFPEYYHDSIFIYEWSRNWIKEIKVDDAGNIVSINPFLDSLELNRPIDMDFGSDGALYVIEWGTGFGGNNADSRIIKISFKSGNRSPNAIATADPISGTLPLTVNFDAQDSFDTDVEDSLTYEWDFDGDGNFDGSGITISNTYIAPGTYSAQLKVTDNQGLSAFANIIITAGNSLPELTIENPVNGGFFIWGEEIDFNISVIDQEDGSSENGDIDCSDISALASIGHDDHGHDLNANENCEDSFTTQSHGDEADNVFYVLRANYTDEGAQGVDSITGTTTHILQPKKKEAEHFTTQNGIRTEETSDPLGGGVNVGYIENGDYISFDPINLQNIEHITFRASSATDGGYIEVRTDAPDGPLLGRRYISSTGDWQAWDYFTMPIQNPGGTHELFFVFSGGSRFLLNLNWIEFHGQGIASSDSNALQGLTASYFNNTTFTGSPIVTKDPMIAFNWEDETPIPGIDNDDFSVRWEGFLIIEETGDYNFNTTHTGGSINLEINDQSLINENADGSYTSTSITLTAGETYPISVAYSNTGGDAAVNLSWDVNQTIHQSSFSINEDKPLPPTECEGQDAFSLIEAEDYCEQSGILTDSANTFVGWIEDGDWVMYNSLDFGSGGLKSITASVATASNGGTIEIRHHGVEGNLIGTIEVDNTGGYDIFETVSTNVSELTGIHPIYFVFRGEGNGLLNIDWFEFKTDDALIGSSSIVHITKLNAPNFAIDGNNGASDFQSVYLYNADETNINQQWIEVNRGDGYYSYQKMNTEYCIDGGDGGTNRQDVYLLPCDENNFNQQWQKVDVGNGAFKLIKRSDAGFAIDGGKDGANRQNVQLWNSGSTSQNLQWIITPINTSAKSINDEILSENIILYPNPVNSVTTIQGAVNSNISIYDIHGRLLINKSILSDTEKIELSNLSSGVYYAKISTSRYIRVIKIIKK